MLNKQTNIYSDHIQKRIEDLDNSVVLNNNVSHKKPNSD